MNNNALKILGNSFAVWVLVKHAKKTKANAFLTSLAATDLIAGFVGIIGAYRQDPGRSEFAWAQVRVRNYILQIKRTSKLVIPFVLLIALNYICVFGEILTILISWLTIAFFSATRWILEFTTENGSTLLWSRLRYNESGIIHAPIIYAWLRYMTICREILFKKSTVTTFLRGFLNMMDYEQNCWCDHNWRYVI